MEKGDLVGVTIGNLICVTKLTNFLKGCGLDKRVLYLGTEVVVYYVLSSSYLDHKIGGLAMICVLMQCCSSLRPCGSS